MVDEHTRKEIADIILSSGPTHKVRAQRFGVKPRTIERWLRGGPYPIQYRDNPVAMFKARVATFEPTITAPASDVTTIADSTVSH